MLGDLGPCSGRDERSRCRDVERASPVATSSFTALALALASRKRNEALLLEPMPEMQALNTSTRDIGVRSAFLSLAFLLQRACARYFDVGQSESIFPPWNRVHPLCPEK